VSRLPELDFAVAAALGSIKWEPRPVLAAAVAEAFGKWGAFDRSTAAALQVQLQR